MIIRKLERSPIDTIDDDCWSSSSLSPPPLIMQVVVCVAVWHGMPWRRKAIAWHINTGKRMKEEEEKMDKYIALYIFSLLWFLGFGKIIKRKGWLQRERWAQRELLLLLLFSYLPSPQVFVSPSLCCLCAGGQWIMDDVRCGEREIIILRMVRWWWWLSVCGRSAKNLSHALLDSLSLTLSWNATQYTLP